MTKNTIFSKSILDIKSDGIIFLVKNDHSWRKISWLELSIASAEEL